MTKIIEKKAAERKHFHKRASQRLGIEATNRLERVIVSKIQHGSAEFIKRTSNRKTVFKVWVDGEIKSKCPDIERNKFTVVYDNLRKQIITIW